MTEKTEVTNATSSTQPKNAYTSAGQNTFLADSQSTAILLQSIDKGGMRGLGLLAIAIAEAKLKQDSIKLARDYYKLNKKDFDFFVAQHEGPIAQSVAEAMSDVTNPVYQYDLYASVPAGIAKTSIGEKQWFETRRRTHRYAIGAQKRIDYEFALMRTHAIAAGWNIGTRYEINYADEHNNRRFDRKIAVSNIGVGIGNIVRARLASSVSRLASANDNLGDTISTIGNGLAARSGYNVGREQTARRYDSMTRGSGVREAAPQAPTQERGGGSARIDSMNN